MKANKTVILGVIIGKARTLAGEGQAVPFTEFVGVAK